jgi:uncharacterized protein
VIKAEGQGCTIAHAAAVQRFQTVLNELVAELPLLRQPLGEECPQPMSPIAKAMVAACWPHRAVYITPMAAVAGSVADEIKAVMLRVAPSLRSLYVNNGGDVSVHVARGETLTIGMVADLAKALPQGTIAIGHDGGVGGIATSGWQGRSFSLGIADAVTVLAASAAEADAAATIIANAVNADDPAIKRQSASALDPDSDLADIPVTTGVGPLPSDVIQAALASGEAVARHLLDHRLIVAAALTVQKQWRVVERRAGLLLPLP